MKVLKPPLHLIIFLILHVSSKIRVEFKESCLKQDKILFNHGKIINIYIVHKINKKFTTLKNCLFGVVKLTKNVNIDQYKYSGYSIGFDRKGFFSCGNGCNVIMFGVVMSSFSHIDDKKKDILILGNGPTQGLSHTMTAEKLNWINFTKNNIKLCLCLHYNGANS